jgi:hypothetical protein
VERKELKRENLRDGMMKGYVSAYSKAKSKNTLSPVQPSVEEDSLFVIKFGKYRKEVDYNTIKDRRTYYDVGGDPEKLKMIGRL